MVEGHRVQTQYQEILCMPWHNYAAKRLFFFVYLSNFANHPLFTDYLPSDFVDQAGLCLAVT